MTFHNSSTKNNILFLVGNKANGGCNIVITMSSDTLSTIYICCTVKHFIFNEVKYALMEALANPSMSLFVNMETVIKLVKFTENIIQENR